MLVIRYVGKWRQFLPLSRAAIIATLQAFEAAKLSQMANAIATQQSMKLTTLLRESVFTLRPEDIGLNEGDCPEVWGVVTEFGFPRLVVSVVALIDGSASIYLSDGGSIIGCGLQQEVRLAAARMIGIAQQFAPVFPIAGETPQPKSGQTHFYLLTRRGLRLAQIPSAELDAGGSEPAKLYWAGHQLIETVETLGAGHGLLDEMMATTDHEQRARQRGRGCRIPSYVGNAVRRSHS